MWTLELLEQEKERIQVSMVLELRREVNNTSIGTKGK